MSSRFPSALDRCRRVLVTGAQSCGKSTLVRGLAGAMNVLAAPEAARIVLERRKLKGGELFQVTPAEKQAVQEAIYDEHIALKHGRGRVVLDRGEIDSYVYSLLLMHDHDDCGNWLTYIGTRARLACKDYDGVLLCPPTIPLVEDGLRASTYHSREITHLLFKGALDALGYYYYELTATTPELRVEESLHYLGGGR